MQQKTIYDVALELAREVGWRNVTRGPLFAKCREAGLVLKDQTEKNWCSNNMRGGHGLSAIRSRLRNEPGITEGENSDPKTSRSGSWTEINREVILDSAYALAVAENRLMIPRDRIAEAAGVSGATINNIWGGMPNLRMAVVAKARAEGQQRLVDQADAIGLTA